MSDIIWEIENKFGKYYSYPQDPLKIDYKALMDMLPGAIAKEKRQALQEIYEHGEALSGPDAPNWTGEDKLKSLMKFLTEKIAEIKGPT